MLRGLWKVARFEYSRIVFRKRFILVLLSPILILVLTGLASMITVFSVLNKKPVGYVDLTGRIEEFVMQGENAGRFDTEVELRAFPDESSGRAALDAEQLEALYIIEEDYFETGRVRMTAYQIPDDEVQEAMEDLLRQNLAALQPEDIAVRLLEGSELEVIDNGEKVEGAGLGLISQIAVPMVFALLFTVIIGVTSGYMLNAVVDEKTNFTAEILLTSVSPTQLMAGKMIGNLAIGLTQLLVWGGIPLLAIGVAAAYFPILAFLEIDAGLVWVSFGLVILGVLQISALLTVLGEREGEGAW
ncbi:MAG: ABC transporter permease [Anaerolineaceae bacterium]|nr:ABC transporter permease [Anaerolineaceae bacterium]